VHGLDTIAKTLSDYVDSERCPGVRGDAVFVPSECRVELVVDETADLAAVAEIAPQLVDDSWSITVVVPQHCLGQAHVSFARSGDALQGWWILSGAIVFSAPAQP
jgi:hypothetical protein